MKNRVRKISGLVSQRVHQTARGVQGVVKVCRFAGETIAVLRIVLMLATEKVRRIGDVRVRRFQNRQRVFRVVFRLP
jgi:hypothetical protein